MREGVWGFEVSIGELFSLLPFLAFSSIFLILLSSFLDVTLKLTPNFIDSDIPNISPVDAIQLRGKGEQGKALRYFHCLKNLAEFVFASAPSFRRVYYSDSLVHVYGILI